jgi:hypothetical protein
MTDPFVQANVDLRQSELAAIREYAKKHKITLQAALRARLITPSVESLQVSLDLHDAASEAARKLRSSLARDLVAKNTGRPSKRKGRKFTKRAVTSDPGKK